MPKLVYRWVRPGLLLVFLATVLAGVLALTWPWMSAKRFVHQMRLAEGEQGVELRHHQHAKVSATISNFWDVEALKYPDGIGVRIVLFDDMRVDSPRPLYMNYFTGARVSVEWVRVQIVLPDRVSPLDWAKARQNPVLIDSLPVFPTYKAALRFHATGEPFALTTTPEKSWVSKGEKGFVVWVNMRVTSVE